MASVGTTGMFAAFSIAGASRAVSSAQARVLGSGREDLVTRSKKGSMRSNTPMPSVHQCAVWPRI